MIALDKKIKELEDQGTIVRLEEKRRDGRVVAERFIDDGFGVNDVSILSGPMKRLDKLQGSFPEFL